MCAFVLLVSDLMAHAYARHRQACMQEGHSTIFFQRSRGGQTTYDQNAQTSSYNEQPMRDELWSAPEAKA